MKSLFGAATNPSVSALAEMTSGERVAFFAKTVPQLFGEEILSILPFLAVLYAMHAKAGMGRKPAILVAWLLTAIVFGAAHLPTYDWNFMQCFVIIGVARRVLLLPYIKTKNIWVSTGAHILTDWIMFGVTILEASATA